MVSRRDQPPASPRTVVLGFDALSLAYLDDFSLPGFDALRSRGVEAPLRSTHPPWTASAWPSMFTGTDPGVHGVYDFFDHSTGYPDEAAIVTREDVRAPALWNYCSARELPSVVCNLPVTYPADRIDGTLIPGYLAPESAPGHPEGVREELSAALGTDYRIYSRAETSNDTEAKLAGYLDLIDLRRRSAEYLLSTREWDLAVIQVQKTDAVFHNFEDRDAHRRVYEAADGVVETVLKTIPPGTNVIVCSDHGIGPVPGYRIYVNEILRREGLVEAAAGRAEASFGAAKRRLLDGNESANGREESSVAESNGRNVGTDGIGDAGANGRTGRNGEDGGSGGDTKTDSSVSPAAPAVTAATSALGHVGITPADVYATAQRLGLADVLKAVVPDDARGGVTETVDWPASAAYCRGRNELGVRLNVDGREPAGVVPESEYEATREAVITALRDLRTPDDEPAFEWVRPQEAVYEGPRTEDACDVLFMPSEMDHVVETQLVGRRFVRAECYDHKPLGSFIASGPAFDSSTPDELSLTDVAPIVMATLGQPIPERMTGTVPDGLLNVPVSTAEYTNVAVDTGADEATDDRITDRLSDLGYL